MAPIDSDIPERFRGDQSIIVAELDGSPIVMPSDISAVAQSANGPVNLSDLPPIATISGVSEDAVDRIAEIVGSWHQATGTPIMPITRSTILKALVGDTN